MYSINLSTDLLVVVADESVPYDGHEALRQRGTVDLIAGVENITQKREPSQRVDVQDHDAQYTDPNQRLACRNKT